MRRSRRPGSPERLNSLQSCSSARLETPPSSTVTAGPSLDAAAVALLRPWVCLGIRGLESFHKDVRVDPVPRERSVTERLLNATKFGVTLDRSGWHPVVPLPRAAIGGAGGGRATTVDAGGHEAGTGPAD